MRLSLVALTSLLLVVWCGAGCHHQKGLTDAELRKLDPAMQALLLGRGTEGFSYHVSEDADGEAVYDVIIRTSRGDALRQHGVRVRSILGDVVTAQATREALHEVVALPYVHYIENPDTVHTQ